MALLLSIFLSVFLCSSVLAAEPIENVLHYQRTFGDKTAKLQIYEISRQTSRIDKPLVIIGDWNFSVDLQAESIISTRTLIESQLRKPAQQGGKDLWESFLNSGFDLYLVEVQSFDFDLVQLSVLLNDALENIWTTRTSQSDRFRIIGLGMGGIIGRLAISLSEGSGLDRTALFVSLDSPHRGAIIPLGIQRVLDFWGTASEPARHTVEELNWEGVRSRLLRLLHVEKDSQGNVHKFEEFPPPLFRAFQGFYDTHVPKKPRMVAFSNGDRDQASQLTNPFGRVMFDFNFDPGGVFFPGAYRAHIKSFKEIASNEIITHSHTLDSPRENDFVYNKISVPSCQFDLGTGFLFFSITLTCQLASTKLGIEEQFYYNIEAAPGGYLKSYQQLAGEFDRAFSSYPHFNVPPAFTAFGSEPGGHSFVPVASALDLNVDTTTREGVWAVPTATSTSKFLAIYNAARNTEHLDLAAYAQALEAEVLHGNQKNSVSLSKATIDFTPIGHVFIPRPPLFGGPCPGGVFIIFAQLFNRSTSPAFSDLRVEVDALTGGNTLRYDDGARGGKRAILPLPRTQQYSDGVLGPNEVVLVPLTVCLSQRAPFELFVSVFGVKTGN